MKYAWFACACSALLAVVGFAHRAVRLVSAESGGATDVGFLAVIFAIYAISVIRAAARVGRLPADQARGELLVVGAIGFVLAFFALSMP